MTFGNICCHLVHLQTMTITPMTTTMIMTTATAQAAITISIVSVKQLSVDSRYVVQSV